MNPMLALRQYQKVNVHAQASEANPHRLVQMLMEAGLDRIAQAKGAIGRKDIPGKGVFIGKAVDIIGGLREGLDMENSSDTVSRVDSLYVYMMQRLAEANIKSDSKILDEVSGLLCTVKEGWDAIAHIGQASDNPVALGR
ncbi:flagellar export chaperone FliS [Pseudomonas sp. CDFA 602]|uniref:flagellar export chaperone FliS n=1 Tax=Pseudomonas californiensis TaxID=2829823 RepID=UPI001E2B00A3|nr:flagellar export chaperone FliS [Pseudomonas californiensis]MCD5992997.1 flagellar export chaperone FliS [Pseudomonas californiensis]MCD5998374.1 flagellar export chaperone FliS [Pseudomonas californiensis]